MTMSMHKTLAALRLPTRSPALVDVAEMIVAAMTHNPAFPAPTPLLADVSAAIAELHDAEVATRTRTRGTVAVRDAKRTVLVARLLRLKTYVQGVAADDPEHATAIIESAGIYVKRNAVSGKRPFDVRPGAVSGSVRMAVRSAGDRASYHWAWSPDGGNMWRLAPATLQARTVISGLPSGATCAFRYRSVTRTGESDWSEPVSVLDAHGRRHADARPQRLRLAEHVAPGGVASPRRLGAGQRRRRRSPQGFSSSRRRPDSRLRLPGVPPAGGPPGMDAVIAALQLGDAAGDLYELQVDAHLAASSWRSSSPSTRASSTAAARTSATPSRAPTRARWGPGPRSASS
jgi:hypothetical protein